MPQDIIELGFNINEFGNQAELIASYLQTILDISQKLQSIKIGDGGFVEFTKMTQTAAAAYEKLEQVAEAYTETVAKQAKVNSENKQKVDDLTKAQEKLAQLQTEEAKQIAIVNEQIKQQTKANTDAARAALGLNDAEAKKMKAAVEAAKAVAVEAKVMTELTNEYKLLSQSLKDAETRYANLVLAGQRESDAAKAELKSIQETRVVLDQIDNDLSNHQRNVGNYKNAFTTAFAGIRQAANILPGIGIQGIFVLLFTAVEKAVDALFDYGAAAKQTAYDTQRMKEVTEAFAKSQKTLATSIDNAHGSAAQQSAELNTLYAIATDVNVQMNIRIQAVKKMQELYPGHLKSLSDEKILNGEIADSIKQVNEQLLNKALAEAAQKNIGTIAEQLFKVNSLLPNLKTNVEKTQKQFDELAAKSKTYGREGVDNSVVFASTALDGAKKKYQDAIDLQKGLSDQFNATVADMKKYAIAAGDLFDGIGKPEKQVDKLKEALQKLSAELKFIDLNVEGKDLLHIDEDKIKAIGSTIKTLLEQGLSEKNPNVSSLISLIDKLTFDILPEKLRKSFDEFSKKLNKEVKEAPPVEIKEIGVAITKLSDIQAQATLINMREALGKAGKKVFSNQGILTDVNLLNDDEVKKNFDRIFGQLEKRNEELKRKLFELGTQSVAQTFGYILDFVNAGYEKELNRIQDLIDKNKELQSAEIDRITSSSISEQDKAAKIAVINAKTQADNEKLARQQKDLKIKEAKNERAAKVAEITASTSSAIIELVAKAAEARAQALVLASSPLTAGFSSLGFTSAALISAQIPIIAATSAIQIASIFAKPIAAYAEGVGNLGQKGHDGGIALVGEGKFKEIVQEPGKSPILVDRPTIMDLAKGTVVTPLKTDEAMNTAFSMGMMNVERTTKYLERSEELRFQSFYRNETNRLIKAFSSIKRPIVKVDVKNDSEFKAWVNANILHRR